MKACANLAPIVGNDIPLLVHFELTTSRCTGRYRAALCQYKPLAVFIVNFVLLFTQEQTPPLLVLALAALCEAAEALCMVQLACTPYFPSLV